MPDVFICHASTDQWRAERVCDALELEGITCWIAPRDVPRQYPHAWGEGSLLNEVLGQARLFLLLLSPDLATSPRIAREIKAAVRLKRTCLSASFDSSAAGLAEGLPLDRHRTRHVEVSSVGGGYEELTDAVREALRAAEPASPDSDRGPGFAFVSYKREDLPRVETHLRTLARIECPVWYDTGIPGGAEWDVMIEARIRSCSFLLVFLSQAAVASKLVRREVKFADKLDKPIVPVLLEPVELDGGLDMLLSQYQIVDSREPDFEARLEAAVRPVLSSAAGSGPRRSTESLSDLEVRLLRYMRGKPDVDWTLDVLSHLLAERPDVAAGPDLGQSVHSLAEKGFFRIDPAGGLTLTPKAVAFLRKSP
jgi:hypothetical protein